MDSKHSAVNNREKSPELYLPTSILRLDSGRSRKLSSEFTRTQKEEVSPQPSVDRLSVTFAEKFLKTEVAKMQQEQIQLPEAAPEPTGSDDEDYSISVNAIIQRRASTRRSKKRNRRASSPFSPETPLPERRRSSVFTTSSGDTAITVDGDQANEVTQDEIFENIKLHKEVLSNVKMQPWNMRKKLKLVLQAKAYIKKHEGQLQERLAQSHSTRDMLARYNIVLIKKWQIWKRELTNMSMWFIPWELKIKEIESHFGSVVASYFIFLRWLFWVNIVIAVVIISFVTIPEIITADPEAVKERKYVLPEERYNSTNFLTLWDFEGVFKYSPLFYGWYTNRDYNDSAVSNSIDKKNFKERNGYRVPFAYFVTGLVVYAYSFFATLRKMAENSRMSKLSEKDDECIFSWKLFTAWDYMIGNAETAHNRVASIVTGFKEALLEETEKKRESRNWKVICFRILVNSLVVGLLSFSAFAVVVVVKRSTEKEANSTVWRRNEITVVMSLITVFFPMLFEILGFLEQYHPRKQLMLQLARIMVLNLLNLYSLIFALFYKISDMKEEYHENFKTNPTKPITTDIALYTSSSSSITSTMSSLTENKTLETCLCTESFVTDITSTIIPSNLTDIAENLMQRVLSTVSEFALEHFNSTPTEIASTEYFNITEFNTPISNTSLPFYDNSSIDNEQALNESHKFNLDDLKDGFVDYLTYILSQFGYFNATDLNITLYNSLNISNGTSFMFNSSQNSTENYEYFKSTILPVFNDTWPNEEERFETEFATVFQEVSTTLATFYSTETISTTSTEEYNVNSEESEFCINYCNNLMESKNAILNSTEASTALSVTLVDLIEEKETLNYTTRARLRSLCWETMFGQELIKLTVMDLIMTVLSTLAMDFFRGIFVRVMNRCWCWDLEKKFPQYGDFKVAENILHLVNNQGMVWLGMFFSPGLVVLNVIKLYIMMYLRAWAVLTCNVPHEVIFRASKSNNFYYALLLLMLFLSVLAVGYAVVKVEPSWHCGPFSGYHFIFHIFTKTIKDNVPQQVFNVLDYFSSPGIVIPLLVFLIMFIYYLISLTGALREANNDLKIQLRRERTEERRKMFEMVDRRRRCGSGESNDQTPFSKWKKLIGNLPSTRSCDETPRQESDEIAMSQKEEEVEKVESKSRVFFTKLIKKALRKSSTSEEEQDGTDIDQHDSLPYDTNKDESTKEKKSGIERHTLQNIVSKAWLRKNDHKEDKKHHDMELKNIETCQQKDLENKSKTTTAPGPSAKQTSPEKNDFLKRILQAKKSGVFDDKNNKPTESDKPSSKQKIVKPSKAPIEEHTSTKIIKIVEDIDDQKKDRRDSESSVWSDNIPVITISKTHSDENILEKEDTSTKSNTRRKPVTKRKFVFKEEKLKETVDEPERKIVSVAPKIRCALKKSSAIDEDVIIHFSEDLKIAEEQKNLILNLTEEKLLEEDKIGDAEYLKQEEIASPDKSTSEETEIRDDTSVDTILNYPFKAGDDSNEDSETYREETIDVKESVEDETDANFGDNEESLEEESERKLVALASGSRSQTESSSYYKE